MEKCKIKVGAQNEDITFEAMKEKNMIECQYIISNNVKRALFAKMEQDDEIDPFCVLNQSESVFKDLMYQSIFKLYVRTFPECIQENHEMLTSEELRSVIEGNVLHTAIKAGTALKYIYLVRERLIRETSQSMGAINNEEWLSKKAYGYFIQTIKNDVLDKEYLDCLTEEIYYNIIAQTADQFSSYTGEDFRLEPKEVLEKYQEVIVLRYLYEIPWYDSNDEEIIRKLIDSESIITKSYVDDDTMTFAHYADIKYLSRYLEKDSGEQMTLILKITKEHFAKQYGLEVQDEMIEYCGCRQYMKVFTEIEEKYNWYFPVMEEDDKEQVDDDSILSDNLKKTPDISDEQLQPVEEIETESIVEKEERHLDELVMAYNNQVKELLELQASNEQLELPEVYDITNEHEEDEPDNTAELSEQYVADESEEDESPDEVVRSDESIDIETLFADNLNFEEFLAETDSEELQTEEWNADELTYETRFAQEAEDEIEETAEEVLPNEEALNEEASFEEALANISQIPLQEVSGTEKDLLEELGWEDAESDEFNWDDDENFLMEALKFDEDEFDFGEDEFDLEYELDMEKLIRGNES